MNEARKEQIRQSIKATRERHSHMCLVTYETKFAPNKLSKEKKFYLDHLFLEGKWVYNSSLADQNEYHDFKKLNRSPKTANVLLPDGTIDVRELKYLSSQMKQDMVDEVSGNIRKLAKAKAKGYSVGKLKFKSVCNCIPLRQFGKTYRIDFERNLIWLQGFKKPFKVRGLKQIPKTAELTCAKLIRKPSGYYIHITAYVEPEKAVDKQTLSEVGIDFGIATNLTLSNGDTYDICMPEDRRVKRASRRMFRSLAKAKALGIEDAKHGKNHQKRRASYAKACEHLANQKKDKANKIVSELLSKYDYIAIQDELIKAWHSGWFGKQVQHSCMGKIKAKLKLSPKVHVVPSSFASTQKCPRCGENTKHSLDERSYTCSHCGYTHPNRDVKAAMSTLEKAKRIDSESNGSSERRIQNLVEAVLPSGGITKVCDSEAKVSPMKQEAQAL